MTTRPHVTVCICTYKRAALLRRLLEALGRQETSGLFEYSIVVTDNDSQRSAEAVVTGFAASSSVPVTYCVEPRQNIALARNRALEHANGDYFAFLDDDEFPGDDWLQALFEARARYGADGVLGPVKPHFDDAPPAWVIAGRFYNRPSYPTGFIIDWTKGRTGNVLMKRSIVAGDPQPFRPEFLTGEDQDFFRRMIDRGHVFRWCEEAVAYEVVPPVRWERRFMLKRALLRGTVSLLHPSVGLRQVAKSVVAVPAYAAALPFAFCAGQAAFMTYLIKLCDHAGRLLAAVGIRPITDAYVTE